MSAPFSIVITDHAIWRVAERFGSFGMDWMEDEILAAFREERVSPTAPPGVKNGTWHGSLYAWTPDGIRVYVLRCSDKDEHAFAVITVMDAHNG